MLSYDINIIYFLVVVIGGGIVDTVVQVGRYAIDRMSLR